jgi:hypothetical protein
MEIRKLISKFLTNIFEKNYSEADKDIKAIVEAKVTEKIKKTSKKVKKDSKGGKPDFLDIDGDGDKSESMKNASKSAKGKKGKAKLSKAENKERFFSKKKNPKKGSK